MSLAKEFLSGTKRRTNVTRLPQGRLKIERWFTIAQHDKALHAAFGKNVALEDEDLTIAVFGGYGLLDGADNLDEALGEEAANTLAGAYTSKAYKDCRLTHEECAPTKEAHQLYQVYELLTAAWALEDADKTDTTDNGLDLLTRAQVAKPGTDLPTLVVGTTTLVVGAKTLYLAGKQDDSDDRRGRVVTRWAEPGIIDVTEDVGPAVLPGTQRITYVSQGLPFFPVIDTVPEPDEWAPASSGTMPDDKAKLIHKKDGSAGGFVQYIRTYLVSAEPSKTITGVKYTYPDFINVDVPGVIVAVAEAVTLGGVSGTIADHRVTGKRRKEIGVTVTVEITTSPPAGTARAFNIDAISCSVTNKRMSLRSGPGATVTWGSETNRMSATGYSQAFSASVAMREYPGYYYSGASATGNISYIGRSWYQVVNNTIGQEQTENSHQQTTAELSGSSSLAGYTESGLVDIKPRPVFATLDGTVYWEVMKWTA